MSGRLTVTGVGSVPVVPDTAVVQVAASHRAPTVAEAMAGVRSAATLLRDTALQHTDRRRIASRALRVGRDHDHHGRPEGFVAHHRFEIGCTDLAAAATLVDALVAEVGDRLTVDAIAPRVGDAAAARRAAREAAWDDALDRARHLAGLAESDLGRALDVVEGRDRHGHDEPFLEAAQSTELEPGEQFLVASLTVTFALDDADR